MDGATDFGEVCHVLTVRLDNRNATDRIDTDPTTWHAVTADGKAYDFGTADADGVAGGQAANLTVRFTLPDSPDRLALLEYASFAARGTATVGPYASA